MKQAVILAGGYGTRMRPYTDTNPKPMYQFEGKPFLEYLVEQLKSFGIEEIVILLGYMPEKIIEYFGNGSKWNINITYSTTPVEYETGLRLRSALNEGKLADEFLLLYCDNYCPIDFSKLYADYRKNKALIQLTAYRNREGYTKNNLRLNVDGMVDIYDKKRMSQGLENVDIGYAIVNRSVLELMPDENENFEKIVYPKLVEQGRLYASITEHRYYSVGSWDRISLTEDFFRPRKVIFLDRDGTLNIRPPKAQYIERPEDFVWLPGAREAIKLLNSSGWTIVLVSNQPGIARGNLTSEMLECINNKMQSDLSEINARIDKIYYCPHNWDDGCFCRKPQPGMMYQAQKDLSIDLTKSWLIGDDERDITAGYAAGCHCIYVTSDFLLADAVNWLLEKENRKQ